MISASLPSGGSLKAGDCPAANVEVRWVLSALADAIHDRRKFAEPDTSPECERLLAFTERHAITALLAWHLKKSAQLEALPPPLAAAFTAAFHASIARSHTQLGELARALGGLRDGGIAAIPWKGPVLSQRIFMEAAARESSDLDILISPESLPDADSVFRSLGYLPANCESEGRVISDEDHCATYRHAALPVTIELHGRPFPSSYPFPLPFGEMKMAANSPLLAGRNSFPVLAAECELLLSAAHAAKHLWSRLSWIADIARLAEGMDKDEAAALHRLASQSRCHRAVQISLLLAEDLLQAAIPPVLKTRFAPTAGARRLARTIRRCLLDPDAPPEGMRTGPAEWAANQLLRMRTREAFGDQIHIAGCALRYVLSPNANDKDLCDDISIPGSLALFLRPIRLFSNYTIQTKNK